MKKDMKANPVVKTSSDPSWVSKDPGYEAIAGSFMSNSTIHGLSRLGSSSSSYRRILWFILFLSSFIFLIYGIKGNLFKMFEHRVVMKTALKHSTWLPFPALTFCNANSIRKSKAGETVLQDFFEYAIYGNTTNTSTTQPVDFLECLNNSGHDIRDMLKTCTWNGKPCGPENFTTFLDMKVGKCYTFNADKNQKLIAEDGQCDANLVVTLNAQPEEYFDLWNDRVGFRVQLHEPGETPQVFRRANLIAPGFSYDIAIMRHKTSRLPDPYPSKCVKNADNQYSVVNCRSECWDKVAQEICKCTTSGMLKRTMCTIEQAACLLNIKAKPVMCSCPPPCVSLTYQTDLSGAIFPSPHQWPFILKDHNFSSPSEKDSFMQDYRQRYVKLSVFYRTMETTEWEELPAYDMDNFFSDLGGMMGLCLGCSLMSVLELLDLVVSLLIYFAYKPKSTKVQEFR